MKKYKIKYQNNESIEEIYLETINLANENLPKNIIDIKEEKSSYKTFFIKKKKVKKKDLNLLF